MDAKSLSARRAWIEIQAATILGEVVESLSARRAWIEIYLYGGAQKWMLSRSPQGERG